MNLLASRRRMPIRLLVPAAAMLTLMGGTAAAAAPAHSAASLAPAHAAPARPDKAPKPVPFKWHAISLLNGWKSVSSKNFSTGTPAFADREGIVYLRGAIKQPNAAGSETFGTLPAFARPARNLYIQVFTNKETPGVLLIRPSGTMYAYDGNGYALTSLAAVSFPTAAVSTHKLALKNGWLSSDPTYQTGNPAYTVSHGVVYLSGSMHASGLARELAFVLPQAARPRQQIYISVYTFDGATGWLRILPDGIVLAGGTGAFSYTSLANISFPVSATKWHRFTLSPTWKPGVAGAPAYAVVNGVVYLNGSMHQASGSAALWAFVPAAARPAHTLEIEVYLAGGTAGGLSLSNLGIISSLPYSNAQKFTSLAGIAYPPSS